MLRGNDNQIIVGAYNIITGYLQNVRNFKGAEEKFKSIMNGIAKQGVQTALIFAVTLN